MYEIFAKLLNDNHVKPVDVTRATGISSTVFSEWKKGKSTPKADKLQLIADYFGVSLEFLLTGKEKEEPAKPVHTIAAHFEGDDYTEEELEEIKKFAEFVKNRRK